MKNLIERLSAAILIVGAISVATPALAQSPIKFGVVGPMTGPFAVMGEHWRQGIETYMDIHGDTVDGHKIEVIYRDSNADPALARQLTQELLVRDGVHFLGGYGLTPEALASAPLANETRTPTFLFHVATPALTEASPYYVLMGHNIYAAASVGAHWALGKDKKTAYIVVADYAPGHSVAAGFRDYFERHGGEVLGEDKVPLNTVDYAPFAERVAESRAEVVSLFIPPGAPAVSMVKALGSRGVLKNSLVIGQGEAEDSDMHLFDDSVVNFHSGVYYSISLDNPQNKRFLEALQAKFGAHVLPSTATIGAYDSMAMIYKAVAEMEGDVPDGDKVMSALTGHTFESVRGEVTINVDRQMSQDYVIRQVQETDNGLRNIVIDVVPNVDPATFGKQ